ncbi:hypothetical protein GC101_17265 [Paenibacillus sp. LMG 31459]|uniref:Uncharacterized protein n=1 Tax=Paenibacillus phytohabitans TaxID=2654978 RepID=A0ABX1YKG7_9BACL|nr:hypothetical protein [Paenibacillus phytohabitans]NOU80616.1 hypothetical protein [Paenibacillus phytohabitans]
MNISFDHLEQALGRVLTADEVLKISSLASMDALNENAGAQHILNRAFMVVGALARNSEPCREGWPIQIQRSCDMKKFTFKEGERLTFFWNRGNEALTGVKATAKDTEDQGVWFEFEGDDLESFVAYSEMHLFVREGSTQPEGTHALSVNQITEAHFGNVDADTFLRLIESLII